MECYYYSVSVVILRKGLVLGMVWCGHIICVQQSAIILGFFSFLHSSVLLALILSLVNYFT